MLALRRSDRPADRDHPFGYGKERYFWSLLAAGAIFVSGAAFSVYQGLHTILGPEEKSSELWINYPVLALAFVIEGTSFLQAMRQVRRQSRIQRRSLVSLVRAPEDPTTNSVAMEDSAALIGLATSRMRWTRTGSTTSSRMGSGGVGSTCTGVSMVPAGSRVS